MSNTDLLAQLQQSYDNFMKVVNDDVLMARAINIKIVEIYKKISDFMFAEREYIRIFDEIESLAKEMVIKYLNINTRRYDVKSSEYIISQCLADEIYKKIEDNIEVDILECISMRVRQAQEIFDNMSEDELINMIDKKKNAYKMIMNDQRENIKRTSEILRDSINKYLEYDECIKGSLKKSEDK